MNIKKQNHVSKKFVAVSIILLAIVLAGGAYGYVYALGGDLFGWTKTVAPAPSKSPNLQPATKEQIQSGEAAKQKTINSSSNSVKGTVDTSTPSPSPTNGSNPSVNVTITAANEDQTSKILQVRAIIGVLTNDGTCTLTLTKGTQTVTKTANVQAQASESTCQGFDVPTSELSTGTWNIALHFENGQYQGDAQKSISIY